MSPSARASDSLIARSVSPACESAARESGGMLSSLRVRISRARRDRGPRADRGTARARRASGRARSSRPARPGGRRAPRLGRRGLAGGQVQLAHFDTQRVHVGIGRAELAERLVDAEDGVLGERDARRMRSANELVQLGERLVDARGKPRGTAPGGLAGGLRDRRQALADRDGVHRAHGERDLDIEPLTRRPGARRLVGHRRQASTLTQRNDHNSRTCSDFPTAMQARYLVTIVSAESAGIG